MHIRFQTPHQYFFIYENVKHLLLLWSKEQHRELYIVEEEGDVLNLRYPGETYRELVLEQLEDIFFQRLETEDDQFRGLRRIVLSPDRFWRLLPNQTRKVAGGAVVFL